MYHLFLFIRNNEFITIQRNIKSHNTRITTIQVAYKLKQVFTRIGFPLEEFHNVHIIRDYNYYRDKNKLITIRLISPSSLYHNYQASIMLLQLTQNHAIMFVKGIYMYITRNTCRLFGTHQSNTAHALKFTSKPYRQTSF